MQINCFLTQPDVYTVFQSFLSVYLRTCLSQWSPILLYYLGFFLFSESFSSEKKKIALISSIKNMPQA